jgi:predicted ArsR family transcriptional regulator
MSQNVVPGKRSLLAWALASGQSIAQAAEQFGVSRRTVERHLARPEFRRRVTQLRAELIASALGRMADNMTRAADTIAALLDSDEQHIRLRAGRAMLSLGLRLRDSVEIADRIQHLEDEFDRRQETEA